MMVAKSNFKYKKFIIIPFLLVFICFTNNSGCGGGEGNRDECQKALDDKDAYCADNPGICCIDYFGFPTPDTDCFSSLGFCCWEGLTLCPMVDICVRDLSQCPDTEPTNSDVLILYDFSSCFLSGETLKRSVYLEGIASGPVGTSVSFSPPPSLYVSMTFCQSWTDCIRSEGDPPATSWVYRESHPDEGITVVISANGSSVTSKQPFCE